MLLPLQGESWGRTIIPRAPLRSALGYVLVAPSGRALNACAYTLILLVKLESNNNNTEEGGLAAALCVFMLWGNGSGFVRVGIGGLCGCRFLWWLCFRGLAWLVWRGGWHRLPGDGRRNCGGRCGG